MTPEPCPACGRHRVGRCPCNQAVPERHCACGHTQDWHASYREHCTYGDCRCLRMA